MLTLPSISLVFLLVAFNTMMEATMPDNKYERIRQCIHEGQQALKDKGSASSIDLILDLVKAHVPKYDPVAYRIVAVVTEFLMPWATPLELYDAAFLQRPVEALNLPDDPVFWAEFWADE
jgi:hypothetical protein